MTALKPVTPLNDYVAVVRDLDVPEGLELPEGAEQMANEGIVVGVGPEVGDDIALGDKVIFRPHSRYLGIKPASGGYEGQTVILIRKIDMVVKVGSSDKYTFI